MADAIQRRRGTTAEHSTFTGLNGEITIDTTKKTVVVHDGVTAGGHPLAKESAAYSHPSTHSADIIVDGTTNKAYTATEQTKLAGVATGAQVNPTNTDSLSEGSTNLYFAAARVRDAVLTGLSTATSTAVAATDTMLAGIGKLAGQKVGFCLSVMPAVGLVSPIFVAPCAMTIQAIDIISRTTAGAAQAPSASTDAVLYKDTTSFDSRAFTTANTSFSSLSLSVAAGDKLNLRVSANNTSGGLISVSYSGVRA